MSRELFSKHAFNSSRGMTLVEFLFGLTIVAILTSLALPTYKDAIAKARVKDAAEAIYALFVQARSEAPLRDTSLSISINSNHWCVGLSNASGCDCTLEIGGNICTLEVAGQPILYRVTASEFDGVSVSENFSGVKTTFYPVRRNASPGGAVVISSEGHALNIKVGLTGRIRLCVPSDSTIVGYPSC